MAQTTDYFTFEDQGDIGILRLRPLDRIVFGHFDAMHGMFELLQDLHRRRQKVLLIDVQTGVLTPDGGERSIGANVCVGYFAQQQLELLDPRQTVLESLSSVAGDSTQGQLRNLLGAFLFRNDEVEKLMDQAVQIKDEAKAREVYQTINKMIMEDAAFVPLVDDLQPIFLAPSVKGFVNPPNDWYDLSTVWIEG